MATAPVPEAPTKGKRGGKPGPRIEPVLSTGTFKLDLPVKTSKRGSETKYPFETLTEVGAAFGVKNKSAKEMLSIVSNQNRKHVTEERDANGNIVYPTKTISDGQGGTMEVPNTEKGPKKIVLRHFIAREVTKEIAAALKGTPLEGFPTIVQRDA